MPIMRNPFRKQDENVKPATNDQRLQGTATAPKEIDIGAKEKEPVEYKLSGKPMPSIPCDTMRHTPPLPLPPNSNQSRHTSDQYKPY